MKETVAELLPASKKSHDLQGVAEKKVRSAKMELPLIKPRGSLPTSLWLMSTRNCMLLEWIVWSYCRIGAKSSKN